MLAADRRSSSGVAFALAAGLGCAAGLLFAYAVHRRCCRHHRRDADDELVAARLGSLGDELRQLRGALDTAKARECSMVPPDEGESTSDGNKVSFDLHTLCTGDATVQGGGGMKKSMSHASTASSGEFVDASEQLDMPNGEAPRAPELSSTGAVADDDSAKVAELDMAELDALIDEDSAASRREAYRRLWRHRVDEDSARGSAETADDVNRSANYLWRLARAGYLCSQTYVGVDEAKRKQICFEAKDYAQAAVKLAPDSGEVVKWYALVLGAVTDYLPTKERIKAGHEFKEHIDRAIELRPTDGVIHHLKGRWCHSVASLSWWERKAAAALYAAPPSSSMDEALRAFLKAEETSPGWLENLLWIAKCHVDKQDAAVAEPYLRRVVDATPANPDDELAHKEAVAMYAKIKK